jgi:hypothetical protein
MLVSPVQPIKAPAPIESTELPITKDSKLSQYVNAPSPTYSTESGIIRVLTPPETPNA